MKENLNRAISLKLKQSEASQKLNVTKDSLANNIKNFKTNFENFYSFTKPQIQYIE